MLNLLVKTLLITMLVFFMLRLMGKRQIGEMQPFELVITLILAEVACLPMNDSSIPLYHGIIPIVALTFLSILMSFISQRSVKFRKITSGNSILIIDQGNVMYENLCKMHINMNDVIESLRNSGNMDISAVQYAIIETSGSISVVTKDKDLSAGQPFLPLELIVDGSRIISNIERAGVSDDDITMLLRKNNIKRDKDVLYLDVRQNGKAYLALKRGKSLQASLKAGGEW